MNLLKILDAPIAMQNYISLDKNGRFMGALIISAAQAYYMGIKYVGL